jgi:hypothetical protein
MLEHTYGAAVAGVEAASQKGSGRARRERKRGKHYYG